MYTAVMAIFFKCLSGLHAGSGAELGIVDLPIQRERHTDFPKVESSGVKGCLREAFRVHEKKFPSDFIKIAFGPEEERGADTLHSGAVTFTDARILLFPVRSAKGVFAYTTCPLVLSRLNEDFKLAGIKTPVQKITVKDKALTSDKRLMVSDKVEKVLLEEFTIEAEISGDVKILAKQIAEWLGKDDDEYLLKNLIVLPDDEFSDFVKNTTEIITRIRIDQKTGTADGQGLFTEELLPAESVMYSMAMASSIFISDEERKCSETVDCAKKANVREGEYLLDEIKDKMPAYLQMGGNATIGKGLVSVSICAEKEGRNSDKCKN